MPGQVVGHEIGEFVRGLIPEILLPVFVVITELGNPAFLLALFVLDYWLGDHERGAHAIGVAVAGVALVTALKTFFDAPRPPDAVNVVAISGYSFPSGHATGATIGYGILAHDLEIGTRRQRFGVAAVVVAVVALSRVVLGVHYVRDVVAGVLVGAVFLAVAISLTRHAPRPAFALAVVVGAAAFVISGASHDGAASVGLAVGSAATWSLLDGVPRIDSLRSRLVLFAVFVPVLAGLTYAATVPEFPTLVVVALNAALMAGVLASPKLVNYVTRTSPRPDSRSSGS